MSSTLFLGILFSAIALGFFPWGLFFWLTARWAGIFGVTLSRALLLGVAATIMRLALASAMLILWGRMVSVLWGVLGLVVLDLTSGLLVTIAALRLQPNLRRITLAWLPTPFVSAVPLLLTLTLLFPFVVKGYVVPTNGMAPTLMGVRWSGACPRCGAPAFASPPSDLDHPLGLHDAPSTMTMICSREMTSCQVPKAVPDPSSPDRLWCLKIHEPRRWDIVVFQYPANPTYTYVQRLVGLPGETVVIDDGAVWINGKRLSPPGGQHYLSEMTGPYGRSLPLWGTRQRPAQLGPDEYFMLGDFSENSSDSRLWQEGAPGHPPYAVPRSCIVGVATHIYWPLERSGRLQ